MHGLAQGGAGAVPTATHAREEPFGVFVARVELAQAGEEFGGDGNFARLVVFGLGNVDDEPLAVDVAGFDGKCLADAQPALIDDGAECAVATVAKGPQEQGDLVAGEDVGKRFLALDVDLFPDVPVEAEVVAVKGTQTANGLVERGGGQFALILEVDEEIEHARRGQRGEILIREMTAELADPAVITQAAPL